MNNSIFYEVEKLVDRRITVKVTITPSHLQSRPIFFEGGTIATMKFEGKIKMQGSYLEFFS